MRRWWAVGVLGAVAALCAPVLRVVLLLEKDLPWTWQDARGFVSDLAVGALLAALLWALSARTRVGALVLGLLWVLLNFMQYEHVGVFDSEVQVTYAGYLTDATFLQGSALKVTHPVLLGAVALLLVGTAWFWRRERVPSRIVWRTALAGALATVLLALFPLHAHHLPWRQLHVLQLTARSAFETSEELPAPTVEGKERAAQVYRVDLSGTPRLPLSSANAGRRHNVLIVALEGLSGGFLPSVAKHQGTTTEGTLPLLDARGQGGLVFENWVGPQRQTNRGLYSFLCGDLPKQTSDEARMSELVRTGEAKKRACLPQLLKDAGWHTAYLQAAPLAFMMKDQFMSSIGFEEVHGNASFPKAYARSKWGMDDKAFFEQAAQRLLALNANPDEKPWFATLLTVGTHHPYIIPDGFGRGTSQERILQYADEALKGLLDTLEEAGALENTLVFITSDESGGVSRGADLTRALSQNWLPMVVLGPDVPAARVVEPYSHPDLAVSVLDYLGLTDRGAHLVGRSLFRRYDKPRPLYFANTYFKRAYALDEDGVLSMCSETLSDCRSFAVDPQRPFGPARKPVPWQPSRLLGWRGVYERTLQPVGDFAPAQLQLVKLGPVEISGSEEEILFGGQYFTAEAGSRYEVELDFEVEQADALVSVEQDLFSSGKVLHKPPLSLLGEGDRVRARYEYVFKDDAKSVEVRMKAQPVQGTQVVLRIHEAKLTVTPNVGGAAAGKAITHHFSIERKPRDERLEFSLADTTVFRKPRCVWQDGQTKQLIGRGCKSTYGVFGPYAYAPKGAKVKGRFEVEMLQGEAKVRADLVSEMSGKRHAYSPSQVLKRGESTVIELEFDADKQTEGIESRLEFRPVSEATRFVLKDLSLVVEPPRKGKSPPVSATF